MSSVWLGCWGWAGQAERASSRDAWAQLRVKNEEGFLQMNTLTGIPPIPPFGKKSKTPGEQASALRSQGYRPLPRDRALSISSQTPRTQEREHRFGLWRPKVTGEVMSGHEVAQNCRMNGKGDQAGVLDSHHYLGIWRREKVSKGQLAQSLSHI